MYMRDAALPAKQVCNLATFAATLFSRALDFTHGDIRAPPLLGKVDAQI